MNDLILIFSVVLPTITLGLWWVLRPQEKTRQTFAEDMPVILMRNDIIEHASESALELFLIAVGSHNWEDLHDVLIPQYPDFPREPLPLTSRKTVVSGTSGEIRI